MDRTISTKQTAYENSQIERARQDNRSSYEMRERMSQLHELRMKLPRER